MTADHSARVYDSMLGLLSSEENPTPIVRLNRVVPFRHATVYAKLEWYNPFGAVKDRVAASMIRDAEERGLLGQVNKLVEPTSGNTGMGLAMIGNARGYSLTTPLSSGIPEEKRAVLRFFGVEVIELSDTLCPAPGAPEGAMAKAAEIAEAADFHQLNQYVNEANPGAHYRTTGPEIWRQTGGRVTHFVAGLGTCGTITGTGRFLKEKNPAVKVLGVHPQEGHDIPGVRSLIQLKLTDFYRPDEYDGQIECSDEEAFEMCLRLNREESIIAGPSSGMALAGGLKMIPDEPGVVAVVIFPDNVFKYSTSMPRHFPRMFPAPAEGEEAAPASDGPSGLTLQALLDNARRSSDVIDVGQMEELLDADPRPVVVDVRTGEEFASEHIEGSINIPLAELAAGAPGLPADLSAPIVTVCNVGRLSLSGMLVLKSLGYTSVRNLMGGLNAWMAEGMPLEYG
ncbi:MAG TPA: pyridoxal-phosphate dependent enzyme [Kofleriaceae bacterium]|nr:pyridoxal-phosphate dependent enzyme [Kofleriaceae bacterium]